LCVFFRYGCKLCLSLTSEEPLPFQPDQTHVKMSETTNVWMGTVLYKKHKFLCPESALTSDLSTQLKFTITEENNSKELATFNARIWKADEVYSDDAALSREPESIFDINDEISKHRQLSQSSDTSNYSYVSHSSAPPTLGCKYRKSYSDPRDSRYFPLPSDLPSASHGNRLQQFKRLQNNMTARFKRWRQRT